MRRDAMREKILRAGAAIVLRQGFRGAGLAQILAAAGVPKGSFHFYFRNKEEFGLALVEHYAVSLRAFAGQTLAAPGADPLERLRAFFAGFTAFFQDQGFAGGCPIGNLCQEMGDVSETFRERLAQAAAEMSLAVAGVLGEARSQGLAPRALDPGQAADFILAAWHGALLRMKVEKSKEPLALFERMVFGRLLGAERA